jgi:hypothetical protein
VSYEPGAADTHARDSWVVTTTDGTSDNGATANAGYTQAGALSKIEYGLRAGSVYGVTPPTQVNFTAPENRTDISSDLTCASGAACGVHSARR